MLPAKYEKEDTSNLVDKKSKQLQDETSGDSRKKPSTTIGIYIFCRNHYMNPFLKQKTSLHSRSYLPGPHTRIRLVLLKSKHSKSLLISMEWNSTKEVFFSLSFPIQFGHNTLRVQPYSRKRDCQYRTSCFYSSQLLRVC